MTRSALGDDPFTAGLVDGDPGPPVADDDHEVRRFALSHDPRPADERPFARDRDEGLMLGRSEELRNTSSRGGNVPPLPVSQGGSAVSASRPNSRAA